MKKLLFLIIIFTASCTTENADNNTVTQGETNNLTGTWTVAQVNKTYDKDTNTLLSTDTSYSTIYIQETITDIHLSQCAKYYSPSSQPFIMVRDNDHLNFINSTLTPYTIIDAENLAIIDDFTFSSTRIEYNQNLTRSSSFVSPRLGSFNLSGALNVSNNQETCLIQTIGTNNDYYQYIITAPFDDDIVELNFKLTAPLTVGNYQYDSSKAGDSPVLFSFDVTSVSSMFINTIGTNGLFPDLVDLSITVSTTELIQGSFSFIGIDSVTYTGDFQFVPYK